MSSYRFMFPGVRRSLVFSGFELKPPASGFPSYSYSSLKTSPSLSPGYLFVTPFVLKILDHFFIIILNSFSGRFPISSFFV